MTLWCSKCHTKWTEGCFSAAEKCPFADCTGFLTLTKPPIYGPKKHPKTKPEYPLLESESK
jgi:hypothetical protein